MRIASRMRCAKVQTVENSDPNMLPSAEKRSFGLDSAITRCLELAFPDTAVEIRPPVFALELKLKLELELELELEVDSPPQS